MKKNIPFRRLPLKPLSGVITTDDCLKKKCECDCVTQSNRTQIALQQADVSQNTRRFYRLSTTGVAKFQRSRRWGSC